MIQDKKDRFESRIRNTVVELVRHSTQPQEILPAGLHSPTDMAPREIYLKIGPITFTIESRTRLLTELLYRELGASIGTKEESSRRLICDSQCAMYAKSFNPFEKPSVEPRSHYWVLSSKQVEASYFPRYRLAWAALPENAHSLRCLLQMLFTLWMEEQQGLLVSGSTVVHHGMSYLLLEETNHQQADRPTPIQPTLLGKEISMLGLSEKGECYAYSTPLGDDGLEKRPAEGAPLQGIFLIGRDSTDSPRVMSLEEASYSLRRSTLCFSKAGEVFERINERTQEILGKIKAYRTAANGSEDFWKIGPSQNAPAPEM
ncbi:MAG: hypothetical protein PHX83_00555 [Acidobacteriia bacterium]|nr:hypothetical protein [Terriglobia bacterium]